MPRALRRQGAWVLGASSNRHLRWRDHARPPADRPRLRVPRARAGRAGRPSAPWLDLDPGDDHRARRDQAPRRRAAAEQPSGGRQDARHRLGGPVLQPLRADGAGRPDRGHAVRPDRAGGPVLALLRLRQRRAPDGARLHVRHGRSARVRRVVGLPGLGRPGRAVRRQGGRLVGRDAAVVDRPRGDVRQVLRRRHRADGRRPEAGGARRGRLAGAGLRHVPLPVLQPRALLELVPHARAVHGHRRHPGLDPGRPRLHPQRRGQHGAARVLRGQLPRPAERRSQLRLLEVARPDRQGPGARRCRSS